MKLKSGHARLVVFLVWVFMSCARRGDYPVLRGPYLDQKPPGKVAELFAPGIVSTDAKEVLLGFFDDGSLFFFERTTPDFDDDWIHAPVYRVELGEGVWKEPQRATTTGRPWFHEYHDAPEGTVIVFPWRKNLDGSGPQLDIDLWRVVKASDGWAEPERYGPPVNTESFDSWPSLSQDETLYFFSTRDGGLGKLDLYRSVPQDSDYAEVENLGGVINTEFSDHDPFVAPDESYLLFCSNRPSGFGKNDLFVAYQTKDGAWTTPINLGDRINTSDDETRPYVTSDGRYLFFNSTRSGSEDIYWVDSKILVELAQEEPR